jgi:hypothetical protein
MRRMSQKAVVQSWSELHMSPKDFTLMGMRNRQTNCSMLASILFDANMFFYALITYPLTSSSCS